MPNDRIDLSGDLDQLSGDLLKDVREAAESEKRRQEEIKTRGSRAEEQKQSRKMSMVIVAVATAVILCLSFYMVFGQKDTVDQVKLQPSQQKSVEIKQPTTIPTTTSQTTTIPRAQPSQHAEQPPTEYDQPSEDPEM